MIDHWFLLHFFVCTFLLFYSINIRRYNFKISDVPSWLIFWAIFLFPGYPAEEGEHPQTRPRPGCIEAFVGQAGRSNAPHQEIWRFLDPCRAGFQSHYLEASYPREGCFCRNLSEERCCQQPAVDECFR